MFRSLYDWLIGSPPAPPASPPPVTGPQRSSAPQRVGQYVIMQKLGEGGMGIVYAARDERLERTVALKTMSSLAGDERARQRFWREARAAASVNHPNICQIYEIGEDAGELFIAMELLEGEALADRLRRGPFNVSETIPIGLGMLSALSALHARGIVHRDLKPSNVFLTPHGVKLLDFGLARQDNDQTLLQSAAGLTHTGMVLGTPRYMAPEQITGHQVDARTDLFAAGVILFEMLAGRPPFEGRSVIDVLHATLNEQPPALSGPPIVAAVDRVIRRALEKRPEERTPSADVMSEELRTIRPAEGDTAVLAHALTRLVVLPFRVLRPDPETDFLAFSLSDAIATSLSNVGSLVVRSSATAAKFAGETPDIKALAAEADVDRVVMGTLVRAGDQLQAAAQLVEAPSGTLLTSLTIQSSLGDLFRLQDDIARRVVEALSLPLSRGGASPAPDAPRNAEAYEFYLRGNEAARNYDELPRARELYQRCLDLDPSFAPAWAQLGRCYRVIGKFLEPIPDSGVRAEEAIRRALELNPHLSIAHKYYAHLEAETGKTEDALVRLLREAGRHRNDPDLFAGLVHACRYCGLFEESLAAHAEARRLDPHVATSIGGTVVLAGHIDHLANVRAMLNAGGGDYGLRVIGLGLAGRRDDARAALVEMRDAVRIDVFSSWIEFLTAWLDRRPDDMLVRLSRLSSLKIQDDPEAMFQEAWLLADAGAYDHALPLLQRAVGKGYAVAPTLKNSPHFDALRVDPAFQSLLADAETRRARARDAFVREGGDRLLGR